MRLILFSRIKTNVRKAVMTLFIVDELTNLVIVIMSSGIAFLIILLSIALGVFIVRAKHAN